jgi:hypothetical protein
LTLELFYYRPPAALAAPGPLFTPAGILAYLAINKAPGINPGAAIAYFVIFNNSINIASGKNTIQRKIHMFYFPPLEKIKIVYNPGRAGHNGQQRRHNCNIENSRHIYAPLCGQNKQVTNTAGDGVKLAVYVVHYYDAV